MRFVTILWIALLARGCCSSAIAQDEQREADLQQLVEQVRAAQAVIEAYQRVPIDDRPRPPVSPEPESPSSSAADRYRYSEQSAAVKTGMVERFPRAIMLTTDACPPCKRMRAENPALIGETADFPVQYVNAERVDYTQFGIPRRTHRFPTLYIVEGPGRIQKQGGQIYSRLGYQSPEALRAYLTHPTHNVSLEPITAPLGPASVCKVSGGNILTALAGHLARQSGPLDEQLTGSLFDIEIDVPDSLPEAIDTLLRTGSFKHECLTLYLPRDTLIRTQFAQKTGTLSFSKPVSLSYICGPIDVEAELHSVTINDNARRYKLELQRKNGLVGIPDLVVVLE